MTEQSKIPVPPMDEMPSMDERDAEKGTLIERVVRNYDLVRLTPPPIPAELFPKARKQTGRYRRKHEVEAEAEAAVAQAAAEQAPPPAPAAAPMPEMPAAPVAEERPEVVVPEVIVPETVGMPPAVQNALVPAVAPVRFTGEQHPVNRQHLRDQGLIVPEGSVTALLEEFRIVKRQLLLQANELRQQGMGVAS